MKHSAKSESEVAKSFDEGGSSRTGANGTNSANITAVAKSVDEDRPPGIAKSSAMTESELAESDEDSPDETGPWSRASGTCSTAATTAVARTGEDRPPGFAEWQCHAECPRASAARRGRNSHGAQF